MTILPVRALIHSLGRNNPQSYALLVPQLHALDAAKAHDPPRVILPRFSVLPSLIHSRIPPEPHVTLLSLGAEKFQLSDAALGELDMKLYVYISKLLIVDGANPSTLAG